MSSNQNQKLPDWKSIINDYLVVSPQELFQALRFQFLPNG